MSDYCPSCGEMLRGTSAACPFCGHTLSPKSVETWSPEEGPTVLVPGAKADLVETPPPPIIVVQPPVEKPRGYRNPDNALYLEFLGVIGFLGIGQIYAGRVILGIVMMILWIVFFAGTLGATVGLAYFCLLIPALLVCYLSGRSARNYLRQAQGEVIHK